MHEDSDEFLLALPSWSPSIPTEQGLLVPSLFSAFTFFLNESFVSSFESKTETLLLWILLLDTDASSSAPVLFNLRLLLLFGTTGGP